MGFVFVSIVVIAIIGALLSFMFMKFIKNVKDGKDTHNQMILIPFITIVFLVACLFFIVIVVDMVVNYS